MFKYYLLLTLVKEDYGEKSETFLPQGKSSALDSPFNPTVAFIIGGSVLLVIYFLRK